MLGGVLPTEEILGGRFKLIAIAGRGASGTVFRAHDEVTGAIVAVKCLGEEVEDARAAERFAREVRLLAAVSNLHVVRYVADGVTNDGRPFVAVEWLEGVDLAQRQRTRPLDGPGIVEVIEQTASGLAALHARGVVHRDVKPSNLFLSEDDDGRVHVRVIDLGVAFTRAEARLTMPGMIIGTPSYMSPEQVRGATLTPRSDVFSLGSVLFQLVSGEKPYAGEGVLSVVAQIALGDPPRLSDRVPSVSSALDAVVARAMAKEPADRFPSVIAFAEALGAVPAFAPVAAARSSAEETRLAPQATTTEGIGVASGERRVVVAVFARFDRAEDAARSADAFDRIAGAHGGTADALLSLAHAAVFGAAHSSGDEAQRAARAALALARETPAALRIVTTRVDRGVRALSPEAIDRGVRRASARAIGIDEATARLLGDGFEVTGPPGDLVLVRERSAARPATFLGVATPCVGRTQELARHRALYDTGHRTPAAHAALVTAPPGAGKSRLRRELFASIEEDAGAPFILLGRGSALGEGAPFGLVGSAIRAAIEVRDDEPPKAQLEKLSRFVRSADHAALVPALAQIASIGDVRPSPDEDGMLVADRLRHAFVRWIASLLEVRPVALVFEDVQWADAPSIGIALAALRSLEGRPLFVIAFARPEVRERFPTLFGDRLGDTIELSRLAPEESEALVRHAVGDAFDADLLRRIVARADGNPFYLEELLRACVDAGGAAPELPDTVLGMVQARLDALGAEGKGICKAASIFGETAWASGVAAVLGAGDDARAIEAAMTELAAREVFERRADARFSGEVEYAFRHALVRDGAYELLLPEDRAPAHLRAAAWLAERGERDALVVARHFDLGGDAAKAGPFYRRAAEQALFGSDFARAIACAERAIETSTDALETGELLLVVAEAKRWSGDLQGALDAASRASSRLALGSQLWFSAMRELVAAHGRLGNKAAIAPLGMRILDAKAAPGATSAQVAALVPAAVHLLYGGDLAASEDLAAQTERLAQRTFRLEPRARARLHQLRGALATHKDDAELGIEEQTRALEAFDEAGDARAAALVRSNLSFALLQLGALERAEATLREALDISVRLGLESVRALTLQNLGTALAWQGRHAEALDIQTQAAALFARHHDPRLEGTSRVHIALLEIARGNLEAAEREAIAVLASGVEPLEIGARAVLARVHLARGAIERALEEAEVGAVVLDRLGSVEEFEITLRLALVEALAANGRHTEGRAALARAHDRVLARRDRIRDVGFRESVVARIPEHARVVELASLVRDLR